MREAMRGYSSYVSPFHRRRSRSFWGVCVVFGFCWVFWFCCLFLFAFHDFEINLGGKKKLYKDGPL